MINEKESQRYTRIGIVVIITIVISASISGVVNYVLWPVKLETNSATDEVFIINNTLFTILWFTLLGTFLTLLSMVFKRYLKADLSGIAEESAPSKDSEAGVTTPVSFSENDELWLANRQTEQKES